MLVFPKLHAVAVDSTYIYAIDSQKKKKKPSAQDQLREINTNRSLEHHDCTKEFHACMVGLICFMLALQG